MKNRRRIIWLVVTAAIAASGGVTYASVGHGSDEEPPLPPDKQARVDWANKRHDALPNKPAAKGKPPRLPPRGQEPPPLTGILDIRQNPFAPQTYVIENAWQVLNGEVLTQVYAGSLVSDPTQGIVIERRLRWPEQRELMVNAHPTPKKEGAVRIVAAQQRRLTLLTAKGTRLGFDADGGSFGPP